MIGMRICDYAYNARLHLSIAPRRANQFASYTLQRKQRLVPESKEDTYAFALMSGGAI